MKNLNRSIIKCKKCPRLVKFRNKISKEKRRQFINENYWGKPVTGFGDINGRMLFVGLAPAAHGATRTGRVFTGDKSSDFLYKCLFKAKISNQDTSINLNDGLKLNNAFITLALKCVPPGDKPNADELNNLLEMANHDWEDFSEDFQGSAEEDPTEVFTITHPQEGAESLHSALESFLEKYPDAKLER